MSVTVSQHKNFVGGEWVDAVDGGTMEVLNPATGETIAEVPRGTQADVDRAVAAAKEALPEWLETTPGERAEPLLSSPTRSRSNAEELAELESRNVGKPLSYARDEMPVWPTTSASSPARRACSRASRPASTCAATRRCCAASRSASSAGSRPGTTR